MGPVVRSCVDGRDCIPAWLGLSGACTEPCQMRRLNVFTGLLKNLAKFSAAKRLM